MKLSTVLLALLPCCAHVSSYAVTGTNGRQTRPATVGCKDLTPEDCAQVELAVDYLNAAFGDTLLVFVSTSSAEIPVSCGTTFDPSWSAESYAITRFQTYLDTGFFFKREIVIFFPAEAMSWASRQTMFRHELSHALGLPHSPWDRTSLMFPHGPPDMMEPKGLNDADLRLLRAIYVRDIGF